MPENCIKNFFVSFPLFPDSMLFGIRLKFKRYLFNEYSNGILMLFGICCRENCSQVDVIFLLWFVYVFVRNNGVILSGLKLPIILQLFFSLIIFMLVNMNGIIKWIETILRNDCSVPDYIAFILLYNGEIQCNSNAVA